MNEATFRGLIPFTTLLMLIGCATPSQHERGPDGTIAYSVTVEASEPGIRIEADNDYVGNTPVTFTIYGDPDGTFHNFGTYEYVIRAYPANPNQQQQTKIFRTGGWFSQEDRIPSRIYFDMSGKSDSTGTEAPPRY